MYISTKHEIGDRVIIKETPNYLAVGRIVGVGMTQAKADAATVITYKLVMSCGVVANYKEEELISPYNSSEAVGYLTAALDRFENACEQLEAIATQAEAAIQALPAAVPKIVGVVPAEPINSNIGNPVLPQRAELRRTLSGEEDASMAMRKLNEHMQRLDQLSF
jgi:hypothetical protein